jgi:hypothetical protein
LFLQEQIKGIIIASWRHSNINRNIRILEAYSSQNNEKIDMLTKKNTGADMKLEILRIKTSVNENATVLQTLFQNIQRRNP